MSSQMPMPGTCPINQGTHDITFPQTTVAYLLAHPGWTQVSKTDWTQLTSGEYINNGNTLLYTRTYAPGTYSINTYSAMYLFEGPASAYTAA